MRKFTFMRLATSGTNLSSSLVNLIGAQKLANEAEGAKWIKANINCNSNCNISNISNINCNCNCSSLPILYAFAPGLVFYFLFYFFFGSSGSVSTHCACIRQRLKTKPGSWAIKFYGSCSPKELHSLPMQQNNNNSFSFFAALRPLMLHNGPKWFERVLRTAARMHFHVSGLNVAEVLMAAIIKQQQQQQK